MKKRFLVLLLLVMIAAVLPLAANAEGKPTITTQPADLTVGTGEEATFQVVAENVDTYQWQYKKPDDPKTWYKFSSTNYTAETDTLIFIAQGDNDGRVYRCLLKNSAGSVYTDLVTLTVKKSGTCGDNLTWNLDDNGVLTISGAGNMTNYYTSASDGTIAPWRSYTVEQVQIQEGVTSIGNSAFFGCTGLTSVTIPESVTKIGRHAFRRCTGLTSVTIPDSVTTIGSYAFADCGNDLTIRCFQGSKADEYAQANNIDVEYLPVKPVISVQPTDAEEYEGETVTFTITASPVTGYQWYYRAGNGSAWTKVAENGTSARYSFTASTDQNGWQFYCQVSNRGSAVESNIVTLSVEQKPVTITTQPTDVTVEAGGTAAFTVTADAATSYQWYYRTASSTAWNKVSENGTSAALTFTAEAAQNGSQYYCVVTNSSSSRRSNIVTLTVTSTAASPVLKLELDRDSCDGWQTVDAKAFVTNEDGSTTSLDKYASTHFYFTIKDESGEVADYFEKQDGIGTDGPYYDALYTFKDNDNERLPAGTYTVTVTADVDGEEKSASKSFVFTGTFLSKDVLKNYTLSLKLTTTNTVYNSGDWIKMTATVRDGNGVLAKDIRVNFKILNKAGDMVPIDDQEDYYCNMTDPNGTCERGYQLETKEEFPAGEYILRAEIDGSDVSKEVPFTFASKTSASTDTEPTTPTIVTQPKNTTVPVGEKATFQVEAENAIGYDWYYRTSSKDDTWKLINSTIFKDVNKDSDEKKATLTFTVEAKQDGYLFRCKAKNAVGPTNSNAATLTVTVPVMEGTCGDKGDNVKWKVDDKGVLTISGKGGMADYDASTPPWPEDIKTVTIEKGVTSIGKQAFAETSITSVTIPSTVTSIGEKAFYKCNKLTSVTIDGNGLTSIGNEAFANCSKLTKIVIPASVTSIGEKAFNNCSNLTSVTINGKNTTIGKDAFANCSKNLTIYCYSGSKAETYAKTNKITYKLLDATQTTTTVPPSAPAATPIPNPFIITQPKGMTVAVGDVALFEVVAANAQSYQWEYRVSSTAPWNKITNSTDRAEILFFIAEAGQNGYEFRCQITNTSGSCCTNTAKLIVNGVRPTSGPRTGPKPTKSVGSAVRIKSTPRPTIYATVPPEIEIFYETPAPTATPDPSKPAKTATPKPSSASSGDITIISQPTDAAVNQGDLVTFSVQATGAVEYHWYYRPVGQDEWLLVTENGDSSTLAFYASKAASGYQFCCEIWGRTDIMYSDIVTLFVK